MKPILRYSHPAGEFKNGLPVGNGRLAAMICGDEKEIREYPASEIKFKSRRRGRGKDKKPDRELEALEELEMKETREMKEAKESKEPKAHA